MIIATAVISDNGCSCNRVCQPSIEDLCSIQVKNLQYSVASGIFIPLFQCRGVFLIFVMNFVKQAGKRSFC